VGVYAYENNSLDIIKSKLFSNNRYTHYSYEGTYNDTMEMSDLDEYFNTDPQIENLKVSGDVADFKINGYICDREKVIMVAQITLPEDNSFVPTANTNSFNLDKLKTICLDENGEESSKNMVYSNYINIEKVEGNDVYALMEFNTYNDDLTSNEHSYRVSLGDFGEWDYNNDFNVESNFDVSFDITVKDSEICTYVDNIDKKITLKNGSTTTIRSIDYSPLRININFDSTQFDSQYIRYYSSESKIANQFTIYYIYNDGKKVFVNRNDLWYTMNYTTEDYNTGCVDSLYVDYDWNYTQLVDFTNIVAIEINGEVIPIK
jgi:hypothetical protein